MNSPFLDLHGQPHSRDERQSPSSPTHAALSLPSSFPPSSVTRTPLPLPSLANPPGTITQKYYSTRNMPSCSSHLSLSSVLSPIDLCLCYATLPSFLFLLPRQICRRGVAIGAPAVFQGSRVPRVNRQTCPEIPLFLVGDGAKVCSGDATPCRRLHKYERV